MLTHNARSLEASLTGIRGGGAGKVEGKSIREIVEETLADQIAQIKKSKLTWVKGQLREPNDPRKLRGKLRLDQAYIGPIGRGKYYVQNMRVFASNGQPLKDIRSISDKSITEMVKQSGGVLVPIEYPSDRARVEECLAAFASQAAKLDPYMCLYCFTFSSQDRKKMQHHIYSKHPKEFAAEMAEAADEAPPEEPSQRPEPEAPIAATE